MNEIILSVEHWGGGRTCSKCHHGALFREDVILSAAWGTRFIVRWPECYSITRVFRPKVCLRDSVSEVEEKYGIEFVQKKDWPTERKRCYPYLSFPIPEEFDRLSIAAQSGPSTWLDLKATIALIGKPLVACAGCSERRCDDWIKFGRQWVCSPECRSKAPCEFCGKNIKKPGFERVPYCCGECCENAYRLELKTWREGRLKIKKSRIAKERFLCDANNALGILKELQNA